MKYIYFCENDGYPWYQQMYNLLASMTKASSLYLSLPRSLAPSLFFIDGYFIHAWPNYLIHAWQLLMVLFINHIHFFILHDPSFTLDDINYIIWTTWSPLNCQYLNESFIKLTHSCITWPSVISMLF